MSQHHHEHIHCPQCHTESEFTVWDSINVQTDPELKEKLMDESLFVHICPHCGHRNYVTFGALYHDVNGQFMLFFDHKEEENDITEDRFPEINGFENFNKNYKLRYVHGIKNLKEKIFIFEEGLSDIAVEMIKYFLRNQVIALKDTPADYFIGKDIFFTNMSSDGETLVFAVIDNDGKLAAHFGISMDVYEQCLQKIVIDERFKEEGNYIKNVCHDWIDAKLKS